MARCPLPLLALAIASPAAAQVGSVEVTPAAATLIAGNGLQLSAVARDPAGRPVSGARVTWSVVPFDVASVDSAGRLTAHRQGLATVIAAVADRRGTARVRVEPKAAAVVDLTAPQEQIVVDGRLVLQAIARTEDGEPLADAVFSFRSSDDRVAAVDQLGVVTGRGEGTAFLVATTGEARGEVRLRVVANRVTRLAVSGPVRGRTGEVLRLRAQGEDRRQLPVQDLSVRWSLSGTGASVGAQGEFVADLPGTYLVTANAGPVAASHPIRIAPRRDTRTLETVGHLLLPGVQLGDLAVAGTTAYLTSLGDRLYTIDLRDPARPALVDSLVLPADTLHGIAVTGDGAVAVVGRTGRAPEQNGLTLLDLADPLHPRVRSEYGASLPSGVRAVALDGRTAYLADGAGALRIISLADQGQPRELGGWTMTDHGTGRLLRGIAVRDGLVCLAYWRHGLVILDVGNGLRNGTPEKPELVSHYAYNVADWYPADMSAGAASVVRSRNYAFLADEVLPGELDWASPVRIPGLGMVHVLDVTNPALPVRVAQYRLPERGAGGLRAEDDVLFVAYGEGGLRALDVSGDLLGDLAAQGRELGAVRTGDPGGYRPNLPMARAVAGRDGLIVASDVNGGLWVTRLTPPRPEQ